MAIDSSIYNQLDTQAPARLSQLISQNTDPLANMQKMLALKALVGQGNLQDYQLSSARRTDQLQNQLLDDLRASGGDPSKIQNAYTMAGQADKAISFQKNSTELQKARFDLQQAQKTDAVRAIMGSTDQASYGSNMMALKTRYPDLDLSTFPQQWTPQTKAQLLGQILKPEDLKPSLQKWDSGAATGVAPLDPITGQPLGGGFNMQKQVTPGERLSASTAIRGQNMTDARAREMNGILGGTPGAVLPDGKPASPFQGIVDAIGQYNTPQNVALMRLPAGPKARVLSDLHQQYPNFDPTAYASNQATIIDFNKGKYSQEIKAGDTALNHIDALRQLSKAQSDADHTGNVQIYNRVANAVANQFGGVAPSNLQSAVAMVAPEIAKAVVGTQSAEADRARFVDALNSQAKSPDQFTGVLDTQSNLLGGRMLENERVYKRTNRTDFRDKYLSPAAQNVIKAAEAQTLQSANPGGVQTQPAATQTAKTATLKDVQDTATASGKSIQEVMLALKAKGYTVK